MSLDRLREWMEAVGTPVAYLTAPISIAYLTGFHTDPYERLMNGWYVHQRNLFAREDCEVRWAN